MSELGNTRLTFLPQVVKNNTKIKFLFAAVVPFKSGSEKLPEFLAAVLHADMIYGNRNPLECFFYTSERQMMSALHTACSLMNREVSTATS